MNYGFAYPIIHSTDYVIISCRRKIESLFAGYSPCPFLSGSVRTDRFFLPSDRRNIALGMTPAQNSAPRICRNSRRVFFGTVFYRRRTVASCVFVRQTDVCPTKTLALRGRAFSRVERLFYSAMNDTPNVTQKGGAEPKTPSYKYSFRLNEEQNICFKRMLSEAGLERNRSRFIVKRIFAERFDVLKRDPTNVQFIARLNDFYYQFQRIGNNYNQIVKAVNSHFSNVAIPRQIAALEQRTRELKALSIGIRNLAKEAMKAWSRT